MKRKNNPPPKKNIEPKVNSNNEHVQPSLLDSLALYFQRMRANVMWLFSCIFLTDRHYKTVHTANKKSGVEHQKREIFQPLIISIYWIFCFQWAVLIIYTIDIMFFCYLQSAVMCTVWLNFDLSLRAEILSFLQMKE